MNWDWGAHARNMIASTVKEVENHQANIDIEAQTYHRQSMDTTRPADSIQKLACDNL